LNFERCRIMFAAAAAAAAAAHGCLMVRQSLVATQQRGILYRAA
jgi:hypothetical protein